MASHQKTNGQKKKIKNPIINNFIVKKCLKNFFLYDKLHNQAQILLQSEDALYATGSLPHLKPYL